MICVLRIPGIRLVMSAEQTDVLFHGGVDEVEGYFRTTGTHIDLASTDLPRSGWDYVSYLSEESPMLILDLDFDFRRIGHSPFVFIVGDGTATLGDYCHHVRQVIRKGRIDSIIG